jgi:hypothetical protein
LSIINYESIQLFCAVNGRTGRKNIQPNGK